MSRDALLAAESAAMTSMFAALGAGVDDPYSAIQTAHDAFVAVIEAVCADTADRTLALAHVANARMLAKDMVGRHGAQTIRVSPDTFLADIGRDLALARMRAVSALP